MTQILKGIVTDEEGYDVEVWVENQPDSDTPDHVFMVYGGSQVGDFAFNQPLQDDLLTEAANRVAAGEAKHLTVYPDPDAVIDLDDIGIKWQ